MKYKVGDKVKVRSDLEVGKYYGSDFFADDMKKYRGKIVTIAAIASNNRYYTKEGNRYYWTDEMFEPVESEMSEMEVGDRITYKYKGKNEIHTRLAVNETDICVIENDEREVLKIERIKQNGWETIYEKPEGPEPILDEVEKEYLWNVIKPFSDKVECIRKFDRKGGEYISIRVIGDGVIGLPYFKKGTMYKGMEEDKPYTLKELGLVEE